jgi:exonuclease III
VRGLNNPTQRQVVRDLIRDNDCTVVCLQETKLQTVTDSVVAETLGQEFMDHYAILPVVGTKGGVILTRSTDFYTEKPSDKFLGLIVMSH